MDWHIKRQNPFYCHRGLLQLYSKCTTIKEGVQNLPNTSSQFGNNCHNLIDICLGPAQSHSDFALYHVEKLTTITHQLQEIFDPHPLLKFSKESTEALTVEKVQNTIEVSRLEVCSYAWLLAAQRNRLRGIGFSRQLDTWLSQLVIDH